MDEFFSDSKDLRVILEIELIHKVRILINKVLERVSLEQFLNMDMAFVLFLLVRMELGDFLMWLLLSFIGC